MFIFRLVLGNTALVVYAYPPSGDLAVAGEWLDAGVNPPAPEKL